MSAARRRSGKPLPRGMLDALHALYKGAPLTDAERREFDASKARQRERDERGSAPQPDLLDGEGRR